MNEYRQFSKEEMILRDYLALDRTILATERTYLSYCRTAVGLLASGLAMAEFLSYPFLGMMGRVIVISAPIVFLVGLVKYIARKKKLRGITD